MSEATGGGGAITCSPPSARAQRCIRSQLWSSPCGWGWARNDSSACGDAQEGKTDSDLHRLTYILSLVAVRARSVADGTPAPLVDCVRVEAAANAAEAAACR
jgi:hypothetical protein